MKPPILKMDCYCIESREGRIYFMLGCKGETLSCFAGSPDNMIELAHEIIACAEEAKGKNRSGSGRDERVC